MAGCLFRLKKTLRVLRRLQVLVAAALKLIGLHPGTQA